MKALLTCAAAPSDHSGQCMICGVLTELVAGTVTHSHNCGTSRETMVVLDLMHS